MSQRDCKPSHNSQGNRLQGTHCSLYEGSTSLTSSVDPAVEHLSLLFHLSVGRGTLPFIPTCRGEGPKDNVLPGCPSFPSGSSTDSGCSSAQLSIGSGSFSFEHKAAGLNPIRPPQVIRCHSTGCCFGPAEGRPLVIGTWNAAGTTKASRELDATKVSADMDILLKTKEAGCFHENSWLSNLLPELAI